MHFDYLEPFKPTDKQTGCGGLIRREKLRIYCPLANDTKYHSLYH